MEIKNQVFTEQRAYYSKISDNERVIMNAHGIKGNYMIGIKEGARRNEQSLIVFDLVGKEIISKNAIGKEVLNVHFFDNHLTVMDMDMSAHVFELNFPIKFL